jgi:protein-tyrosine phosphatase
MPTDNKNFRKKILMVCLGNICRSPVAEGILRKHITDNNISDVLVDSAGTSDFHIGEAPHEISTKNALKNNVDISGLRARQFSYKDFSDFDQIYAMDDSNYQNILKLAKTDADKAKVEMILNKILPNSNAAVPDPYFGGLDGFEEVFQLLNKACKVIAEELKNS